ncbi:G-type lectin S-receptor-like serine/threonine-protein kinase [Abeliophyllum distichum]|uniref:Receptor-like serine/threonine-protein kinase n=1 Tax=Abeliophyllum distichum TaxID=126358 RepID=A0ABD1SS03_9LAMI
MIYICVSVCVFVKRCSPLKSNAFTLLLISLLATSAAVLAADIPLGSTLYASDPNAKWTTPNGTTLSFITDPVDPTSGAALFAAITFNSIPIWKAGGSSASVNSSAVFRLVASGDLQLLPSSTSTTPLWSSGTGNLSVTAVALEDTGNLILKNASGSAVWTSFDHPTDVIVPTQSFTLRHTLSSGLYSLKLQENGNLTLWWNDTVEYYNSGLNSTGNSSFTNPNLDIRSTGVLTLSDPTLPQALDLAYSSDYGEEGNILRFLKLDNDGNLRIYSSAIGSRTQTERWAAVDDQCQRDSRKGCRRKVELRDCPGSETMLPLEHSIFLTYPPELSSQIYYIAISACKSNCLVGSCNASTALSDGSGQCYLKSSNFISGYHSPAIPSTSFMKVCGPVMPTPSIAGTGGGKGKGWRLTAWLVVVVVVVTLLGLVVVEGGLWWWCFRNSPKFGGLSAQYALLEYASGAPVQFSYKELQKATKGFKEKLGAGGFGAVYRGLLANRTTAAVKQLEGIEQGEKQFRMEVVTISSTHHLNLVRLIGFCSEGRHRLLVYEFMKNGSLDNFLFVSEEQSGKFLSWEYRYSIALGTAKGITYLHEECRDCIVHCDIKPENILLDENYNAKVSDFGLAKLVNPKDHRYRTLKSVRGTRGYLAPEWLANLPITSKSDVYSYGMVLLEIVSGKRNFAVSEETDQMKFSVWAYEEFEKGNFYAIVDKRLPQNEINMEQVIRAIQVSFWCIQEQPSQRPMMGKVVQMLEGIIEIDRPPAPKAATEGSVGGTSLYATSSISAPLDFCSFSASSFFLLVPPNCRNIVLCLRKAGLPGVFIAVIPSKSGLIPSGLPAGIG